MNYLQCTSHVWESITYIFSVDKDTLFSAATFKKGKSHDPTALQKTGREGLNVTTEGPIRKINKFTALLSQSPELNVGRKLRVFMVVALHVLNNKYVGISISIRYPISNMFLDLHVAC